MRYFRRGVTQVMLLASAPASSPTQTQLTAGVDLDPEINDMTGWTAENSPINVPDLASDFTGNIGGERTVGNPAMTLYEDDESTTIWDAVAPGTSGYMALCPEGQAATEPVEVWHCRVIARNRNYDAAGNVAATYSVQFAVPDPPDQDAVQAA